MNVPFRRQSEPHRPDRHLRRDHILHLRCERIPDVRQGPLSSGRTLRPTSGSLVTNGAEGQYASWPAYCFNSVGQFSTSVSGRGVAVSTGRSIRKRSPSGATAYWSGCGLMERGSDVWNSARGVPGSKTPLLSTGTTIRRESGDK